MHGAAPSLAEPCQKCQTLPGNRSWSRRRNTGYVRPLSGSGWSRALKVSMVYDGDREEYIEEEL